MNNRLHPVCLHHLIERQARLTPDHIAVVHEDSRLTYRELDRRSNLLAAELRTMGVGPDALVGLLVERSLDLIVGIVGILKAGGAYVPMDAAYPQERIAYMLDDAKVKALVAQSA
jgi:non-ribosomal peptide synthetase component F